MKLRFRLLMLAFCAFSICSAQEKAAQNWFHLDPATDSVPGVATIRTYQELLNGRQGEMVVVAVLDSGVDYEHEDLKNVMWVNDGEIPNNGIDDDQNGYVDDIHGWNFIGNADGRNIHHDNLEVTRLYAKYKAKFENVDEATLSKDDKELYQQFKDWEKTIKDKQESVAPNIALYGGISEAFGKVVEEIGKEPEDITADDINQLNPTDETVIRAVSVLKNLMAEGNKFADIKEEVDGVYNYYYGQANYYYNPDFDPREIVGDDFMNKEERIYGNSDVRGPDSEHGTHVAGIIGAERGNGIGMDGVSDKVRIMSVRVVPDGDERDKDVANAIRYAVDNGASIINMSFGKGWSPYKSIVDDAIKYAMKNDVLLVHAAGNDGKQNNFTNNYPNDRFNKKGWFAPRFAKNWIEVGASHFKDGGRPANFSNYSPDLVDVFAPGVEIYSTVPGSKYRNLQGTSMASPVVAGVAAVLRSYFPDLSAKQIKSIIMDSTKKTDEKVKKPGSDEMVPYGQLSVTGGLVNVYQAVIMAGSTKGKKRKTYKHDKASDAATRRATVRP
ncbi:MAG: S8 family peptidase [Saprospiraceae bacterium]|nr:S8 family peptidase [Saprospiraceae bacterium]